jgi:hypothetical protein
MQSEASSDDPNAMNAIITIRARDLDRVSFHSFFMFTNNALLLALPRVN